ncbi:TPA: restriction endonuclease subunit S [Pseudomonas aeruginosa]
MNNGVAVGPQGEGMDSPSNFSTYPAYKDSGVEWLGEVPEHWAIFSLKRSVDGCTNGLWGDEPDGENDLAVIRVADFDRATCRVGLDKLTYRGITKKERASRLLQSGDLLIEKSGGGEKTLVGCVVLFEHDFEAITSNFVARMRPLHGFDSGFLCYSFDSLYQGKVNFPAIKQTTGIQNLDSESYLQERFCFPTLAEQTQIARFLDHETARIDALIEEQQRLIELLKEKRQAVISHAVTKGLDPAVPMKHSGVEWLGEVPAHWAVCQVRHLMVGDTRNGLYKPEGEKDPDGVGFVQMGEAFRDRIFQGGVKDRVQASNAELKNWGLEEGDLLFARRSIVLEGSGRCTRVGLLNEPHLFESSMIRIRLDLNRVSPEYLHLMFDSIGMRAQVLSTTKTVTISGIDSGQLKGLRVAVPAKSEQENIAAYLLSRIEAFDDAERAAMETTLLLQERRSALISAAVTGKIDVRGWQPPASTHAPEPAVAEAV